MRVSRTVEQECMRSCLMGVVEEHADTIGDESAPLEEDEDSEDQYSICLELSRDAFDSTVGCRTRLVGTAAEGVLSRDHYLSRAIACVPDSVRLFVHTPADVGA